MLRALFLVSGLAGGALLIISEFSSLYEVRVAGVVNATISGGNQHNYALLVIGLAALGLVVGAVRGSRPAAAAVAGLGLLSLAIIGFGGDLHDIHSTGVAGQLYERAAAGPKSGFYEETLGVALLLVSGGGTLVLGAPRRRVRARPPRARAGGESRLPPTEPTDDQAAAELAAERYQR
jgi:hypothetical protein